MRMAVRQSKRRARSSALLNAVMKGVFSHVSVQVFVGQLHGYNLTTSELFVSSIFFFFFKFQEHDRKRAASEGKKASHNREFESGRVCCIEYLWANALKKALCDRFECQK